MLFLPEKPQFIIDTLYKNGYEAYAVGGCVRDMLCGITPHDYDITTSAPPEIIQSLFEKTVPTGIKHGTVTVILEGTAIEVTTYRTDGKYSDSRHPENVKFVKNLKEDLARRDFTVNAMSFNCCEGLRDYFGGQEDIKAQLLRTVGDPEKRFTEDALRILRLFRFSSVLGFNIENNTLSAALKLSAKLQDISAERICAELKKAVNGKNPAALTPITENGSLEFLGLAGAPDYKKISLLQDEFLKFFTLFYSSKSDVLNAFEFLKVSNKEKARAKGLLLLLSLPFPEDKPQIKEMIFKTDEQGLYDYLDFQKAFYGKNTADAFNMLKEITENNEPYKISDLKIDGGTLTELGLKGKSIGKTLQKLRREVVLDPTLNEKEKLIKKAIQLNSN